MIATSKSIQNFISKEFCIFARQQYVFRQFTPTQRNQNVPIAILTYSLSASLSHQGQLLQQPSFNSIAKCDFRIYKKIKNKNSTMFINVTRVYTTLVPHICLTCISILKLSSSVMVVMTENMCIIMHLVIQSRVLSNFQKSFFYLYKRFSPLSHIMHK